MFMDLPDIEWLAIHTNKIEELPTNGRNPMSVAEFAPGFQPLNTFGDGLQVTRAVSVSQPISSSATCRV